MPIDIDTLLAADPITWDASWTAKDVMLYHLGIGAGVPATDPAELRLTYEDDLIALPSFGTIPGFLPIPRFLDLPGFDIDFSMLVHGEHDLQLPNGPLPTEATATSTTRPVAVHDKRSGASVIFETTTAVDDKPVAINRMTAFVRGEGGFGGDPGPSPDRIRPPKREPDAVVTTQTLPQQALLYRLSGDANPLHADPAFAEAGGFDRPILHGMCTFGIACKAAVQTVLDGDHGAVSGYQARFSGVVLPGEAITTSAWREGDEVILEAHVEDRTVLKQARMVLR